MRKIRDLLLSVLLTGMVIFFVATKTHAQTSVFGKNSITLLPGAAPAPCPAAPAGCTQYNYTYTGTPTTIEVLIPKSVQTKFAQGTSFGVPSVDSSVAGCNGGLFTNGEGDTTNGFGVNIVTHNLCKVTPSTLPIAGTFFILADASNAKPISWQEIVNKSIAANTLNGPAVPATGVQETAATLTTAEGVTASYTIQGGTIIPGAGVKNVFPITKLCIPWSGVGTPTFTNTSGSWTCETITFATEQCDIKTAGTDPCRYIGGSCINY